LETDSDVHKAYRSDNYRLLTSIIGTLPEGEENQLRCDGAFPRENPRVRLLLFRRDAV